MRTCPECGGVIGRDCFNPEECQWIGEQQRQQQNDQSRNDLAQASAYIQELEGKLRDLLNWRPMDAAPKDGTIILLRLPDSDVPHSGFWGDAKRMLAPIHTTWRIAWDHSPTIDEPTGWLPLPKRNS